MQQYDYNESIRNMR